MSENRTGAAPGTAAERRRARARKRLLTLGIGCAVLAALTLFAGAMGLWDVADSYRQFRQRESTIAASIEAGNLDVTANVVQPHTPYSGFWDLRDLSTEDTQTWPNFDMARFYGIDSILGE